MSSFIYFSVDVDLETKFYGTEEPDAEDFKDFFDGNLYRIASESGTMEFFHANTHEWTVIERTKVN